MSKKQQRPSIARTNEELQELYDDQVQHLKVTVAQFDAGQTAAYRRIAASIRILAYDTGQSQSLLKQLNLLDRRFLSCARQLNVGNLLSECELISLVASPGASQRAEWSAGLDNFPMHFVTFEEWWNTPIMTDHKSPPFSRRDIVANVANQDGGMHVDPAIDEAFQQMRRDGFRWANGINVSQHPDRYALRQIAHELLKSLDPKYKRRPAQIKRGSLMRGAYFGPKRTTVPADIVSYHLTPGEAMCPCGSEMKFATCHGIGAQPPIVQEQSTVLAKAPLGATQASVGIRLQKN